ncbi:MAG: hypothetical protein ABI889_13325 [Gemmatimonadota bacterium]
MRREMTLVALMLSSAALGCESGAENRAKRIDDHEGRAAAVRASETAQRLATPPDSGRIIYDQPTDLSMANARRTGTAIVGIEKVPQPAFDSSTVGARSSRGHPSRGNSKP